jgi:drug/metabolite transporter (DMT)-like permease
MGLLNIRTSTGTLLSLLSSTILLMAIALIADFDKLISLPMTALLWLALIGLVNFVIGRQCNFAATKRIGATRAISILATSPLFAMLFAVVFTGEEINLPIVAGALAIALGLYLVVTSGAR